MLSTKKRINLLAKIAQQAATPATSTTATTPATAQPATIAPPPQFQASSAYGWLSNAYNSTSISTINNLCSTLNIALHYASNGQFNFQILRDQSFQFDPSSAPSVDAKNLLNISALVYKTFLNSGNAFPTKPTGKQIKTWGDMIGASQAFLNLSQLNPTGIIAQKIQGNLKDNILNYIRYLEAANP